MKTKYYKSTYNVNVTIKIGFEEDSNYGHIRQRSLETPDYQYIGIIVKITKKGFYYRDNFGVKIYVTWNKLLEINLDE